MTPEWAELIHAWGYWLMAFGAIIEGETFLVIGGIAAASDLLHLPGLIALAIVGCLIHDSFFFYFGRYGGRKFIDKRPKWQAKIARVTQLLEKYDFWLIIAFRFAYGLRTIIPFSLGLSRISNLKFFLFDLLGAIIWSCVFIIGGYYFGHGLVLLMHELSIDHFVKTHWLAFSIGIIVFVFAVWLVVLAVQKYRKQKRSK